MGCLPYGRNNFISNRVVTNKIITYFTDREKETERLLLNFRHGVNTVLISPRRWGKTTLVQKVCRLVQSDQLKVVSALEKNGIYQFYSHDYLPQTFTYERTDIYPPRANQ